MEGRESEKTYFWPREERYVILGGLERGSFSGREASLRSQRHIKMTRNDSRVFQSSGQKR